MDGPLLEHSDSDSGDSWTLLETNPAFADEAPEFAETPVESPVPEIHEKDEDTDGISIISDSDHESHSPYQVNYEKFTSSQVIQPTSQYVSVDPHISSFNSSESLRANNEFLGDNNKHRIYVHRRNKQLSTVLNIIVLGSVITAAGVAIGHMWGAKNECLVHNPPAVNKILSNLYKLQEENAYLRNKLKELSQYHQSQQTLPIKQNRCKKMFEEPLSNKNVVRLTKCLDNKDNESNNLASHFVMPLYEKQFITDVKKLENIYQENKNWLDEEITNRLKVEEEIWNKNVYKFTKSYQTGEESQQPDSVNYRSMSSHINTNKLSQDTSVHEPFIKISYADSLKTDKLNKQINKTYDIKTVANITRLKNKKNANEKRYQHISSDDEIKKDDRYTGHKNKHEKKKNNRHKSLKKQKRQNKYEQWEMKGGFIKDYDDFSISSQDIELTYNNSELKSERLNKKKNVSHIFTETESTQYDNNFQKDKKAKINKNDSQNWYDIRAKLRNEARKKLEQELFGEVGPNKARWYFRRMQKREQCRIKDDNANKKLHDKRDMNYKLKH